MFICYRRQDSPTHAARLRDRLNTEFGPGSVFLDTDDIKPGEPFPDKIRDTIKTSDVLLVVIGPRWLGGDANRLHDAGDFVRDEIRTALRSGGVKVIPVLVNGGAMPPRGALPEDIDEFSDLNAAELLDGRWDHDTQQLVVAIRDLMPAAAPPSPFERFTRAASSFIRKPAVAGLLAALLVAALGVAALKYLTRPQELNECLVYRVRDLGIPQDRAVTLEVGTSDYTVIPPGRPKAGTFLLKFTDSGRGLGAVVLDYYPPTQVFKVVEVIGPDCATNYFYYGNEDRPGIKETLQNWDRLILRFQDSGYDMPYRLRVGDHGDSIRASFEPAPENQIFPYFQPSR